LDEVMKDARDKRPRRLQGLPRTEISGRRVPVATSRRARLLGLSHLDRHRAVEAVQHVGAIERDLRHALARFVKDELE